MFSVIVPFRNRFEHLDIFAPLIKNHFKNNNLDMRLVVVEQNDSEGFRRGGLINVGASMEPLAQFFVPHDIDYLPTPNTQYWQEGCDVFLPVKYADFIHSDMTPCELEEVSKGYQHFSKRFNGTGVDGNFWGAVNTIRRDVFFKTSFDNGQKFWGFEDYTLRERCIALGIKWARHETNEFQVLNHDNKAPSPNSPELQFNMNRAFNWKQYITNNVNTLQAKIEVVKPKHPDVDQWILTTEFDGPPKPTHIVTSNLDWMKP